MRNMTEFVRVRQFDSEERGGGWQILSGRIFIFCIASATNPEYFEEHFLKAKRNKHTLKSVCVCVCVWGGGGVVVEVQ